MKLRPRCADEISKIATLYPKKQENGMEVIFISLDEEQDEFTSFSQDFPFLSFSDYKKME